MPRHFCKVIDEWIEVDKRTHSRWLGLKATFYERTKSMMTRNGFEIEKQSKRYGKYVRIHLSDVLRVEILDNPYGITIDSDKYLDREPNEKNANKIGFMLQQTFEALEDLPFSSTETGNSVVVELPGLRPLRLQSMELVNEADTVVTASYPDPDTCSPFESKLPYYGG